MLALKARSTLPAYASNSKPVVSIISIVSDLSECQKNKNHDKCKINGSVIHFSEQSISCGAEHGEVIRLTTDETKTFSV